MTKRSPWRSSALSALTLLFTTATSLAAGPASGAATPAGEDPFAVYDRALNRAANELQDRFAQVPTAAASSVSSPQTEDKRFEPPPEKLRQFAQRYWNGQEDDLERAVSRVQKLLPAIEPVLRDEGVPVELSAVILVESAGRTTALSPRGARGIWQFVPETARRYGLVVSRERDDRLDIPKSTRAAARYLRDLYSRFESWPLVFAAYNVGEQAVQRAMNRSGADGFLGLSSQRFLPAETRNYVPAVTAALDLFGGGRSLREPVPKKGPPSLFEILYAKSTKD